ncbi:MAG: imidazole glycerol phosphate synthase subunit HisH [Pseudomonadota bacterium]
MSDVVIIDSGGANLASLVFALRRLGQEAQVSSDAARIRSASHVLLPGVGSAGNAMARLNEAGLSEVIPQLTQPVLGICLGMQLLFDFSSEADAGRASTPCLGIVPGSVERLVASTALPVPHMGWNRVVALAADPLFEGMAGTDYFYFVHSYAAPAGEYSVALTEYGEHFTAAVRRQNFRGVQFHPERSAQPGAKLLANFLRLS